MHPFLDVAKLSDEEIIDRLGKAYTYMNMQKTLGHSPSVLSIREVIQSLESERNHRMQKLVNEEYSRKFPDNHKPIELGKIEE